MPPTRAGYEQVLDFYRLTDTSLYSFGRVQAGPQFFTDIRRNVAILRASRGVLPDEQRGEASGDKEHADEEEWRLGRVLLERIEATSPTHAATDESPATTCEDATLFADFAVSGVGAPGLNLSAAAEAVAAEQAAQPVAALVPASAGDATQDALVAAGEKHTPFRGPFHAFACVDWLGESYMRDHDAEFKLVSQLCMSRLGVCEPGGVSAGYRGR